MNKIRVITGVTEKWCVTCEIWRTLICFSPGGKSHQTASAQVHRSPTNTGSSEENARQHSVRNPSFRGTNPHGADRKVEEWTQLEGSRPSIDNKAFVKL